MNLFGAYNHFCEERITLIKDLADIEQELKKYEREYNKAVKEKASDYDIETLKKLIEMSEKNGDEIREILDFYFAAAEAIRFVINLRKNIRSKEFNPWQLFLPQNDKILGTSLKVVIYGKE